MAVCQDLQTKILLMETTQPIYFPSTSGPQTELIKKVRRFAIARWKQNPLESPLHGPKHWDAVARNGERLAIATGANVLVTQLFAYFHDLCRIDDGNDSDHGRRAAKLAMELRFKLFKSLTTQEFTLLQTACEGHTVLRRYGDATIDTCFDADRLDLTRLGITLDPALMATEEGRRIAQERR